MTAAPLHPASDSAESGSAASHVLHDGVHAATPDLDLDAAISELPEVLTVEEAARVLRIGRNAAYEQARRWRETGGSEGLPVIHFGRTLRVPRRALAEMMALKANGRVPTTPAIGRRRADTDDRT